MLISEISSDVLLSCPKCGGALLSGEKLAYRRSCEVCREEYPCVHGVSDFSPWQVPPTGLVQRLMLDRRIIRIYESRLWRASRLFQLFTGIGLSDEIALVSQLLAPGAEDTLLDISCGTGIYTRSFARGAPGTRVIGLDLSWPMLEYAVEAAQAAGLANITWLRADAHFLPLRDGAINAVNCTGALHLFSDVPRVLAEVARVMPPGGRFSVAVFRRFERGPVSRLQKWFDEKALGVHPFSRAELTALFDAAGFDCAIHHVRGTWMIAVGVRRD